MNFKNIVEKVKAYYIIYFGIVLIVKEIGPYSFVPGVINAIFILPAGFLGILFVMYDFFDFLKNKKKLTYDKLLITFTVILMVTTLVNYQYAITANVKLILNEIIYFFVIFNFTRHNSKSLDTIKTFLHWLVGLWFVLVTISLGMFVTQTEYIYILENRFHPLRLGFVENRLFGIFSDPNFAATICLVTVAVSLYYLFQKKKPKRLALNIFFVINIIFQLAFVVLSGSRTGLLELYVVLLFATFMYTYQFNFKQNKKMYQKLMISILASGIMFLSAFVSLKIIREVFITVPSYIVESVTTIENDGNSSKIKKNRISKKINLSRADVENSEDVSNGRVNIWKTGIKLFNEQKIIGVGPSREGIVAFAEDKFPDSVIAKTGLSLHSFLVQTLTGTGILGFIVFFSFFILNMLKILLHSFKDRKFVYSIDFVFYLITLLISINAVVSSEIVLVNKIGAFIFWLLLGRVLQAVINDQAENY